MDDGELDFSNYDVLSNSMTDVPSSDSLDSWFEELLKDTHACTHTHTCNPPGPDLAHTHTCYHVHTKILASPSKDSDDNDKNSTESPKEAKKRPLGNREAVKKYREKKKAKTASLEDEVVKLRAINQQLLKRLHGQAALEAELARLRCLLVDIRGRVEGEIGTFPYQKPINVFQNVSSSDLSESFLMNPCNIQCNDQIYCLRPSNEVKIGESYLDGQGVSSHDLETLNCFETAAPGPQELVGCRPCSLGGLQDSVRNL